MIETDVRSVLKTVKETIDATMNLEIGRFVVNPSYGWVNTKVYPLTGEEKNDPDRVVTLIQGRALEALSEHIDFYAECGCGVHPDSEQMRRQGAALCEKIRNLVSDYRYVPQFISRNGIALSPVPDKISMNDLFCAKGLYSWHHNHGTEAECAEARRRLFDRVDEVLGCDSGIFEDRMVGVGAMALVLKYEKSEDAFLLGKKLVNYIIGKHFNDGRYGNLPFGAVFYRVDGQGNPHVNADGSIEISSGDNIQFTGLTAQFLKYAAELPFITDDDRKWMKEVIRVLVSIIKSCFSLSFVSPFGFHLWTDGVTGRPIEPRMGWWQVAEAARGCILVSSIAGEDSAWLYERGLELIGIFQKQYRAKSPIGIAVQMLESDGSAVKQVPGNPDIDAGYHTGLTHIAIYRQLAEML